MLTFWPAGRAEAHPIGASSVLLDIGKHQVDAELRLPLEELAIAVRRPLALAPQTVLHFHVDFLRRYVARHVALTAEDGEAWKVQIGRASVRSFNNRPHVVMPLTMLPP